MQNRWPEGLCLRFGSLVKKMALAAVMLMRPGSRGSPSWPRVTPRPDTLMQTDRAIRTLPLPTGRPIRFFQQTQFQRLLSNHLL